MNFMRCRAILAFGPLLALSACTNLGYNQREKIAVALLDQSDGQMNTEAYTAALNVRFPAGSSVDRLVDVVHKLGGNCRHSLPSEWECSVPRVGFFCAANAVGIKVSTMPSGAIEHLVASNVNVAC
jgi:hypothetical protein